MQPTATPTSQPTVHLKGACLSVVNQPHDGFDRTLFLDASFDERNLEAVKVQLTGASNDEPADGTQPLSGIWRVTFGINQSTQGSDLSLTLAAVTKAGGASESFLDAIIDSIGSMDNLRPNHSVGDSCGGFG